MMMRSALVAVLFLVRYFPKHERIDMHKLHRGIESLKINIGREKRVMMKWQDPVIRIRSVHVLLHKA